MTKHLTEIKMKQKIKTQNFQILKNPVKYLNYTKKITLLQE